MEAERSIVSEANLTRFTEGVEGAMEEGNLKGKERRKGGIWSFAAPGQRAGGSIVAESLGSRPDCSASNPRATQ